MSPPSGISLAGTYLRKLFLLLDHSGGRRRGTRRPTKSRKRGCERIASKRGSTRIQTAASECRSIAVASHPKASSCLCSAAQTVAMSLGAYRTWAGRYSAHDLLGLVVLSGSCIDVSALQTAVVVIGVGIFRDGFSRLAEFSLNGVNRNDLV